MHKSVLTLTFLLSLGFALYRALLRQIAHVTLPNDLLSRPGWDHPLRYLMRSGFARNKTDTSPRLITSAFKSGYRFLTLLSRAHDSSSAQHAEIVAFLRERQASFPPDAPPKTFKPPAKPPVVERERPLPILTKISAPGEKPVYTSTFRPRPLHELSGGVRKVPVIDGTSNYAFLRIGKPQSHWHANFLRRKADKRYARIHAALELWDDVRPAAAEEDRWESTLAQLAAKEGVDIGEGNGGDGRVDIFDPKSGRMHRVGQYEYVVREFGTYHIRKQLDEEADDMIARAKAFNVIVQEERELAVKEKEEKRERRYRAWVERERLREKEVEER